MTSFIVPKDPLSLEYFLTTGHLSDETDLIQLGNSHDRNFYSLDGSVIVKPSSWNTFPTDKNPDAKYKYSSVRIIFDKDL